MGDSSAIAETRANERRLAPYVDVARKIHAPLITSQELISSLKLARHPEHGHFVETDKQSYQVPSPFADGDPRPLATSIYYMLCHNEPEGVIHMNKSVTYHVLHHGRAEYTLITPGAPGAPGTPPQIETKIMGTNTAAGETRQLLVGTGVWKMSRLLPEDIAAAKTQEEKDQCLCLITEVVVPGFHWEDHQYLTREGLEGLFREVEGGEEMIRRFEKYVK